MIATRLRLALLVIAGFAVGGAAALALFPQARERLLPGINTKVIGQALVGGPFTLTDHTGKRVTDQDFHGRTMLVFFGFTFCPDVCPSGLQVMSAALDKLGPKAERVVPILITVDPERDTPAQLALYVSSFHPRLIGLTGTPAEIEAVAKAYRAYVKKVEDPKSRIPPMPMPWPIAWPSCCKQNTGFNYLTNQCKFRFEGS
jgi:protein SCO1/2